MKKLQVEKSTGILAKQNYLLISQVGVTARIEVDRLLQRKGKKCKRGNFPAKSKFTGLKLQV